MKITIVQEKKIAFVEERIERGLLPEEARAVIDLARSGHPDAYTICRGYESRVIRRWRNAEGWFLREAGRFPFGSFSNEGRASVASDPSIVYDDDPSRPVEPETPQLDPHLFRKRLGEMIHNMDRPQRYTPAKIIDSALKKLGMLKGMHGYEEAVDTATRILSKKMSFQIVSSLRRGRFDPLPIPPNPSSRNFEDFLTERIGIDISAVSHWTSWDGWPLTLANVFAVILGDGISPWHAFPLAKRRSQEIDLKGRWYRDIDSLGIRHQAGSREIDGTSVSNNVAGAIGRMYRRVEDADRIRRAKAEYARFDSTVHAGLEYDGEAVRDLYRDMLALHRDDLDLGGKEFIRLLTPHVTPMTPEEIEKAVRRRDVPGEVQRQTALTVLYWHTRNLHGLAGWLTRIVRDNKSCRTINSFCTNRLGFTHGMMGREMEAPPALMRRLDQMADAGVELALLIGALNRMFPNSVPRHKADELLQRAREARAGAMRLAAVDVAPAQPAGQTETILTRSGRPIPRGNGPRKLIKRGTRGTQMILPLPPPTPLQASIQGAEHFVNSGQIQPTLPGIPDRMLQGIQLTLPGFPPSLVMK